jgi:heme oxygenase
VSAVPEGAALGAAFLGRMAAGLETSITDAARWASTERVLELDPAWAARWKTATRVFSSSPKVRLLHTNHE